MGDAQDILKIIESVEPEDTDKLDEIDARVWCYLNIDKPALIAAVKAETMRAFEYTRSRDALKAIRPGGWFPCLINSHTAWQEDCGYTASLTTYKAHLIGEHGRAIFLGEKKSSDSPELPTEELAELHAIIQAIQHERGSDD